jgi:hypothetical protein
VLSGLSCATRPATCTLPGLGAAFMHRPAWKKNSQKLVSNILHRLGQVPPGRSSSLISLSTIRSYSS